MSNNTNTNDKIPGYMEFIEKMLDSLDLPVDAKQKILAQLGKYDKVNQHNFLTNQELKNAMLAADTGYSNLIKPGGPLHPYESNIRINWDKLSSSLGQLQGLSILNKISPSDCGPVIKELINAFNTKINSVNSILADKLESTPGPDTNTTKATTNAIQKGGYSDLVYKNKYLKYKQKYLQLKNNL